MIWVRGSTHGHWQFQLELFAVGRVYMSLGNVTGSRSRRIILPMVQWPTPLTLWYSVPTSALAVKVINCWFLLRQSFSSVSISTVTLSRQSWWVDCMSSCLLNCFLSVMFSLSLISMKLCMNDVSARDYKITERILIICINFLLSPPSVLWPPSSSITLRCPL